MSPDRVLVARGSAAAAGGRRDGRAPRVGGRRSRSRGGRPRSWRTPSSRCRRARSSPSLTGAEYRATAPPSRRRSAGCSSTIGRPRRIGLIVPDPVAKVSLVRFEQVPARATISNSWSAGRCARPRRSRSRRRRSATSRRSGAEGQEFVVALARRDVVREYEELCAPRARTPGIVDISTFNVVNAVLGAGPCRRATGCWSTWPPTTPRSRSCAARS